MASTTSRTNDPDRRSDADRGRSPAASRSSRAWAPTQSERPRPCSSASAAVSRGARRSSSSRLGSARGLRTRPSRFVARTTASSSCPWTRYPRPSPRILWSRACHMTSSPRGSAVRRSSSRAFAALLVARAVMEAIAFACLLALVHMPGGLEPLALTPTTFALIGATLVLVAALRETGSEGRGTAIVGTTLGVGLLVAVLLPTHPLDVVSWGGRIITFVIVAEIYLWRVVSLARGAVRWSDARNAVPFGALALAIVSTGPARVDSTPLVPLALIFIAASAVALSVARSAEELSLTTGTSGPARLSSANSVVFALGIGALIAALAAPALEQILSDLGQSLAPAFDEIIFTLLLPLGYLAALVYAILEPLLRRWSFFGSPAPQAVPRDDPALLREIERTRPFVIGGFEIVIVIVVILVALVLFERAVRERRLTLPEGTQLERAAASGLTLGATLRSLFPRRSVRRRAPHDDGTPAAALRLIYWRLLALAERAGQGWRAAAETPAEHQIRIAGADPRWAAASPIVAAFEDLRYGELAPDLATVARARDALRALEAAVRT